MSEKFKLNENKNDYGKGKLRFIPLGGNGQVTKNMFVYEYGNDIILIDCGMGFPSEMLYGVDMVIPDISYLTDKRQKIRALLITHGHEDHIGAIPYIIDKISVPIYATKLTIGLIKARLKEANKLNFANFIQVEPGNRYQIGAFSVEPFQVSHSIPDSVGYYLSTPLGSFVHTGDYKFDWSPIDGRTTDVERLTEYGKRGVLALMSDCLRSEKPGTTLSEANIGKNFEEAMMETSGRVLITTFASNVSRIQQGIDASLKNNRKVAIAGRSMEQNVQVAVDLGYLKIPKDILVRLNQIENIPDRNLTLIVAGSQGQPGSTLSRVAGSEHKFITIKKGDLIIFSADPIPGNQDSVYEMIDSLSKLGAEIKYSDITSDFHVSGHAAQSELMLMLSLVRPKYLVPISGMHRQMQQYALLARGNGIPSQNIFVIDEGGVIEFDEHGARTCGEIETTNVFVDGIGVGDVGSIVLRDRKTLAEEGIVVVIITIHKKNSQLLEEPEIVSRGFVYMRESEDLMREAVKVVKKSLGNNERIKNWMIIRERVTEDLEKFLFQKTARRPMVLPVIIDV